MNIIELVVLVLIGGAIGGIVSILTDYGAANWQWWVACSPLWALYWFIFYQIYTHPHWWELLKHLSSAG